MPEVSWTDKHGYHSRVFHVQTRARGWFERLPIETEGLESAALTVRGHVLDRWYRRDHVWKKQSVHGPPPTTSLVKVLHESEHGSVVLPVRQYAQELSIEQVRQNLREHPIQGVDPDQVKP